MERPLLNKINELSRGIPSQVPVDVVLREIIDQSDRQQAKIQEIECRINSLEATISGGQNILKDLVLKDIKDNMVIDFGLMVQNMVGRELERNKKNATKKDNTIKIREGE